MADASELIDALDGLGKLVAGDHSMLIKGLGLLFGIKLEKEDEKEIKDPTSMIREDLVRIPEV